MRVYSPNKTCPHFTYKTNYITKHKNSLHIHKQKKSSSLRTFQQVKYSEKVIAKTLISDKHQNNRLPIESKILILLPKLKILNLSF